jgi:hypothetical protein
MDPSSNTHGAGQVRFCRVLGMASELACKAEQSDAPTMTTEFFWAVGALIQWTFFHEEMVFYNFIRWICPFLAIPCALNVRQRAAVNFNEFLDIKKYY